MIIVHFIYKFDINKTISNIDIFNLTSKSQISPNFRVNGFYGAVLPRNLPMK